MSGSLFAALAAALASPDVEQKLALTRQLAADWQAGRLDWQAGRLDWQAGRLDWHDDTPQPLSCGRPPKPALVPPLRVPQRNVKSPEGRARLLHAIVHIEFTAINLALDHAARFRGLPAQYYADWIGVAAEEADHFDLLRRRLGELGHAYGDFPAHAGLWHMAEKTQDDVLARMALVPRLLEARGLDATPPIQQRLAAAGDQISAGLLDTILRDEIGHVGLGDRWFRHLCAGRGLDAEPTYRRLLVEFDAPWPSAPLNEAARLAAGFSAAELAELGGTRN